ncbi:hypothetical protein D3C87_1294770 [compost metagenome]
MKALSSTFFKVNSPLALVMAPTFLILTATPLVPSLASSTTFPSRLTKTFAPASGLPSSSSTRPVTSMVLNALMILSNIEGALALIMMFLTSITYSRSCSLITRFNAVFRSVFRKSTSSLRFTSIP